jgi:hypothetical protein
LPFSKPGWPVTLNYAPWIDDPDPPDYMTDEQIDRMADAIAAYMKWPPKRES